MQNEQERRAAKDRVAIETLVEICGNEPGIPAFEAEAMDVSARGMHLRTAYLPESGAPLVCRFENHGQEIVVEGVVAWRKESQRGGEFGVKFTALDARSVDALRGLVQESLKQESGEAANGSRVRLHIEGLGAPMKARIRGGGTHKLEVGSNLEFLKVGRKLEIEDLEAGARRNALIDGVDVVVDPETRVPQLVVALRYEGVEEDTPQPSVTDLRGEDAPVPERIRLERESVTAAPSVRAVMPDLHDDFADDDAEIPPTRAASHVSDASDVDDEEEAGEFRSKLGGVAGEASKLAVSAGSVLKRASEGAWRGMGGLFQGASEKVAKLRGGNAEAAKRTTAAPPGGPMSISGKHVHKQPLSEIAAEVGGALAGWKRLPPKKKMAAGAGASVLLVTLLAVALKPSSPPPGATAALGSAAAMEIQGAPVASDAVAAAAPATLPGTLGMPAGNGPAGAVNANVPLFGPTPMATTEPAPLGPSNQEEDSVGAAELAEAKAMKSSAKDEEFAEEAEAAETKPVSSTKSLRDSNKGDRKEASTTRPEDVAAFGRGKLHLPTIHRLRLDGPGGDIRGVTDPTGFTVLIPNRKLMEQGAPMAKRDARIARARTTNTPGGAQLRVEFKDGIPGYRVRLRRDYIELLVSAPVEADKATKAVKATKEAPKAKPGAKKH